MNETINQQSPPPKVTIGMPVYNGENFIREAIDSILLQTFQDFEVVISDNASTDGTKKICEEYARKDRRIKFISHEYSIGGKQNFSFTLRRATGKYFTWLAHDDYLMPTFLDFCVALFEERSSYILVSGDFKTIDAYGNQIAVEELKEIRTETPWEIRIREFFRYPISNCFLAIYGLFHRDKLLKVFDYTPQGPLLAGSELPLLSRLAVLGEIASTNKILRAYRFHQDSSYHKEKTQLKTLGITGYILIIYNLWWKRFDQQKILLTSTIPLRLKLSIFCNLIYFYTSHSIFISKRIAIKLMQKLLGSN